MGIGGVACPKPEPLKRVRGRKTRAESKVKKSVRAQCVERDGHCRACLRLRGLYAECFGPSEWAHLDERKRFKTRGMAPEKRHTTADSLMLCKRHHDMYDGRLSPRLSIEAHTPKGADDILWFWVGPVHPGRSRP